jgi:hypothetical protein
VRSDLGDGFELDDDRARLDRDAQHWVLHTSDAHALYVKLGFGPNERLMERVVSPPA